MASDGESARGCFLTKRHEEEVQVMNSIILKFIIEIIVFAAAIVVALAEHHPDNKKEKILFSGAVIAAIAAFSSFFLMNEVPTPNIDRETDYSAIVLSTAEAMNIEYRISTNGDASDEWIKYEEPFRLEKNAVIYARASTLWFTSEPVFRDVYVSENGLVYFGGADEPGDTIVSIEAAYNYTDAVNGEAGNHYVGYEIKKSDIKVMGTDLKGNEKELTDFTYAPKILRAGTNDIQIEYAIAADLSVKTYLHINGDTPAMMKLDASYVGGNIYLDTVLDSSDFIVEGTFEDGTIKTIKNYSISPTEVKEGKNIVTITKDGLSDVIELTAIDRETIVENESEPNDDIKSADEIDVNVKYSGALGDEDDIDYYRLRLEQKGKIIIKMTHPKMDVSGEFWVVSFLNQEEDIRVELRSSGRDVETTSSPVRVTPGVYYIKVSNYNYSNEKYTLTVLFEEEGDSYEDEPNDDLNSQAMSIRLDKEYTGNLTSENDVDYYKFSISEKRKIWIDFSHDKTSGNDIFWKLSLFGDSDGSLIDINATGENAKITSGSVRLPAGNYYIRINSYYWSDLDYTFCVCSKPEGDESENEDNGDYVSATPIAVNSSIVGNLQTENDVDFYTFDLKGTTSIKVTFIHDRVDKGDTFWIFELYSADSSGAIRNNEDYESIRVAGNSPEKISSQWNSLPKGTYYLKVYSYYYNNADYKIKLSD